MGGRAPAERAGSGSEFPRQLRERTLFFGLGPVGLCDCPAGNEQQKDARKQARATAHMVSPCFPHGEHSAATPSCGARARSEEHTSELQSLMRNSYAVFSLQKQK